MTRNIETARSVFAAAYLDLESQTRTQLTCARVPGRDRDEFTQEAIATIWRVWSKHYLAGRADAEDICRYIRWTVRSTISHAGRSADALRTKDRTGRLIAATLDALANDDAKTTALAQVADSRNHVATADVLIDTLEWLDTLTPAKRQIVELLLIHRPADVARKLRLTPGRICQVQRDLREEYFMFHGELA